MITTRPNGRRRGLGVLGGALLAWCLVAAVSALLSSIARSPDPMSRLQAEFQVFAWELPATGEVGYLEPHGASNEDAVRMHYAAQYALAPRVVVGRVGPEFLIVARGMALPEGDERLAGYYPVATFPSGHRLFRRLVP